MYLFNSSALSPIWIEENKPLLQHQQRASCQSPDFHVKGTFDHGLRRACAKTFHQQM
ncbi:uncharacterized protein J3R85_005973 [Psidium guajava]|nr:uncharacterized protein J3R85_005973 [Psidium guajava]